MKIPALVSTREVLQQGQGVKIGQVQTIQLPDDSLVEVYFWYNYTEQDATLHHVSGPHPVEAVTIEQPILAKILDGDKWYWNTYTASFEPIE